MVIWLTGMSGSGKSTLSDSLHFVLKKKGYSAYQLDGDNVRKQNSTTKQFSKGSIIENNCSIIHECVKNLKQYDFQIVSVISPFNETRQYARRILKDKYFEIFVKCPIEELIKRDTKGLYKKSLQGRLDNLIGFSDKLPFEVPVHPNLVISTDKVDVRKAIYIIIKQLLLS